MDEQNYLSNHRREADYHQQRIRELENNILRINEYIASLSQRAHQTDSLELYRQLQVEERQRDYLLRQLDEARYTHQAAVKYRNLW